MSACPYCGTQACDAWAEIAHMQSEHPEIIAQRLEHAGFARVDDRWIDRFSEASAPVHHDTQVDVRVCSEQAAAALAVVHAAHPGVRFSYDPDPPAAGPEAEVSFHELPQRHIRELLERAGVFVLAIRTRSVAH